MFKELKKIITNHLVSGVFIIPNFVISLGAQAYFVAYLHWTGWLAILSWCIGAGGGFELGQFLAVVTKSNFRLGKWRYSYALKEGSGDMTHKE